MAVPPPELELPQPKILLEGASLTFKTDAAFELAEHPRIIGERLRRWHIPLVSSEWETRSEMQPTKGSPGASMINYPAHLEPWALEAYETYVRLLELHVDYYWILDRFHLSTLVHQRHVEGRECDLSWVDRRLADLGFRLVILTRTAESFEQARAERLKHSENPWRYTDLDRLIGEQDVYRRLATESAIPSVEIDVTGSTIAETSERILDWVESSGGFYRQEARNPMVVPAKATSEPFARTEEYWRFRRGSS